jgi:CRISPR-associated exonuclease Cas4
MYCPRYTYFEYVLHIPQNEEKYYKVMKGRHIHDEKLERNKDYLRRRLGVQEKWLDQYLAVGDLRGRLDEVLLLEDGSMAPLDYKFAVYEEQVYNTYKIQLSCYAWLVEQVYQKPVNRGYLVYVRSKNKVVEVQIEEEDKAAVKEAVEAIRRIVEGNEFPRATKYKQKCLTCTYRNICVQ